MAYKKSKLLLREVEILSSIALVFVLAIPASASTSWAGGRPSVSSLEYPSDDAAGVGTTDNMESTGAWSYTEAGGIGFLNAATGGYTTSRYKSASNSVFVSFSGGASQTDYGYALVYRDYDVASKLGTTTVSYYIDQFSHDLSQWDSMDAGIRIRLFDKDNVNIATYQYWLASWYHGSDVKAPPDSNTIRIASGKPTMNTWLSFSRNPTTDWSIKWEDASLARFVYRVRLEFYVAAAGTVGDSFRIYMDDLSVDVTQRVILSNKYSDSNLASELAVEVFSYQQNWMQTGDNFFGLRIMGAATSRPAHRITNYLLKDYSYMLSPNFDPGLSGNDVGKWVDIGRVFYYYGRPYSRIFVCTNGWAAFSYVDQSGNPAPDGSSCTHTPQALPTADSLDSNGRRVETPDGVIAPLWRHLSPAAGQIKVFRNTLAFQVFWNNVPNYGNGATNVNTFHFELNFIADDVSPYEEINFGYTSISSNDPTDSVTKIGLEDPAGVYGIELKLSDVKAAKGVAFGLPHSIDWGLVDSKVIADKQVASDSSRLLFDETYLAGNNIQRSSPPPPSSYQRAIATATDFIIWSVVCGAAGVLLPIYGTLGCLALNLGVAVMGELAKDSRAGVKRDAHRVDGAGDQKAWLEVPVQSDLGNGNSDSDMSLFDLLYWRFPATDTAVHRLEIEWGVAVYQKDCAYCYKELWYWTGVVLSVGPAGVSFDDPMETTAWSPGADAPQLTWLSWEMSGLWHMTANRYASSYSDRTYHSIWYGKESTKNYDTGSRNTGSLTSPLFNVKSTGQRFCYRSWWDTETGTTYDKKIVQYSLDRGKTWTNVQGQTISEATDPRYTWVLHSFSLDAYVGKEVAVRFFFDTVDGVYNTYEGWYIDDVSVVKSASCPTQVAYLAAMAEQGNGAAYARASGGASCSVTGSSSWNKFYDNGQTRKYSLYIHFADYQNIRGKVWTVLDAPGMADESYFDMKVYKDSTLMESYATSSGGSWSGYIWSSEMPIGTTGTWKFVVSVWGLDYGSQQCSASGEFYVYNQ